MKICKDCRWYVRGIPGPFEEPKCSNPKASRAAAVDLVTGETKEQFCRSQRIGTHLDFVCGENGKWFEPREPEQAAA